VKSASLRSSKSSLDLSAAGPAPEAPPPQETGPRRFDDTNTRAGLAGIGGIGVVCPPVDERLLAAYFSYFVKIGFLEPPPTAPAGAVAAEDAQLIR
jgi:hypothetical protein